MSSLFLLEFQVKMKSSRQYCFYLSLNYCVLIIYWVLMSSDCVCVNLIFEHGYYLGIIVWVLTNWSCALRCSFSTCNSCFSPSNFCNRHFCLDNSSSMDRCLDSLPDIPVPSIGSSEPYELFWPSLPVALMPLGPR